MDKSNQPIPGCDVRIGKLEDEVEVLKRIVERHITQHADAVHPSPPSDGNTTTQQQTVTAGSTSEQKLDALRLLERLAAYCQMNCRGELANGGPNRVNDALMRETFQTLRRLIDEKGALASLAHVDRIMKEAAASSETVTKIIRHLTSTVKFAIPQQHAKLYEMLSTREGTLRLFEATLALLAYMKTNVAVAEQAAIDGFLEGFGHINGDTQ